MSEQKEYRVPLFGILLLFVGVLFLLQTMGILPWDLWRTLWRFWPVIIIIIGLNILLRRSNPWITAFIILAVLLASLGIAMWQYGMLQIK